jgi:hypothetical protein
MLGINMHCHGQELLSGDHEFWHMLFLSSSSFFTISVDNVAIIGNTFS